MATMGESEPSLDILQPEVLSKSELISLIQERNLKIDRIQDLDKGKLLELYYKYVIPMPQRKYRLNRRGREMTKNQVLMAKRKRTYDEMSMQSNNKDQKSSPHSDSSVRLLCSYNVSSSVGQTDRLKPPPSAINPDRKVIKLGKTVSSSEHSSANKPTPVRPGIVRLKSSPSSLDNIEIKTIIPKVADKPMSNSNGNSKKTVVTESQVITGDSTVTVKKMSSGITMTKIIPHKEQSHNNDQAKPRKIKLNRSSFSKSGVVIPQSVSHEEETKEKDVKSAELSKNQQKEVTSSTTEETVTKKFKKVSVNWP